MSWILSGRHQEGDEGESEGRPFEVELYLPPNGAELNRCPACYASMDYADGICSECGQIVCPRCGSAIDDEDEVCPDCRLRLVFPCPGCHFELTAGTEVCPDCNTLFVQTCSACGTRIWDGATACPQCDQTWELSRYDPIHATVIREADGSPVLTMGTCPTCSEKYPFRHSPCPTCGHIACPTCQQNLGPNATSCPRCGPIRWASDEVNGTSAPEEEDDDIEGIVRLALAARDILDQCPPQ